MVEMVDGRELFQDAHAVSACENDEQLEIFVQREEELVEFYLQVNPAEATDAGSILANYDFSDICSTTLCRISGCPKFQQTLNL